MQRKLNLRLPEKRLMDRVQFEQPIPCNLNIASQGKTLEQLSPEEVKANTVGSCVHKIWPPSEICIACMVKNKHELSTVDKKGRTYRLIENQK